VKYGVELCDWLRDYRARLELNAQAIAMLLLDEASTHISFIALELLRESQVICIAFGDITNSSCS
jgi:hypothetical protein